MMTEQYLVSNLSSEVAFEKLWLASQIIENTQEGIIVTDENGEIFLVNPAFTNLTGYDHEEAVLCSYNILTATQKPTIDRDFWEEVERVGKWQGEIWLKAKNGTEFSSQIAINTLYNPKGHVHQHVLIFNDNTSFRLISQQASDMAFLDPLTKLPNRLALVKSMEEKIVEAKRENKLLALLVLDLDRFKIINDTLGHQTGDQILIEISNRLKSRLAKNQLLARLGGDEFAFVHTDLNHPKDAIKLAELILENLQQPYLINGQEIHLSSSIGISFFPSDSKNGDDLFQLAEIALYKAKNKPSSSYEVYSPGDNKHSLEHLLMENNLRHALKRNEFRVYFQPHVEIKSGLIQGGEALLRWQHPQLGLISPGQFLPLAEETGLIAEIDTWVLKTVCDQLYQWRKIAPKDFYISANLSTHQINQPEFLTDIKSLIKQSHISPNSLELEMTERIIVDNMETILELLKQIRKMGIRLSIDDFGTGHSSLSNLANFQVNHLKIDRAFVKNCMSSSEDASIISAIINMCHNLNLQVIAEGVETKEQLNFLRLMNCDSIQGFIYSPAVQTNDFENILKEQPFRL